METETSDKYNKGIAEIVDILYSLRRIEFSSQSMSDKYREAYQLIQSVTKLLVTKKNFVAFRPMWEELHDRMVYYYDFLNKENINQDIPLFRETLHNELVKWWLRCKKRGIVDGPLVHFNTHDDMGLPDPSSQLLKKNGRLDEQKVQRGACGKIFWPVTCMLLSKGINHVIWAMPKWVYDDNAEFQQVLMTDNSNELIYLRPRGQKKDKFRLTGDIEIAEEGELDDPSKYKFFHPHQLNRIKVASASAWKRLGNLINSNKFILDIDLDFFVTNGDKHSLASYQKDFDDIESTGRVHGMPGVLAPREAYGDDISKNYIRNLNKEIRMVRERVKIFLSGLATLKKMGITPCCISISDSTTSFFSGKSYRAVLTNQYTPKYFVPVLYELLISGMRKIYGTSKFY